MVIKINKPFIRATQGLFLASGAPLGWLAIQWFQGVSIWFEVHQNMGLYLYMLLGTMSVFACFGWYVGHNEGLSEQLAIKDPLTGLFNVRYFRSRLAEEVAAAKRHDIPFALIIFDLDHFKLINDQYGHPVGDKLLVAVSDAARKTLRSNEVIARVGGEEFAVILPYCSVDGAKETAERIRQAVKQVAVPVNESDSIKRTVSLGIAAYTKVETSDSLYLRADNALYAAKQNGRDQAVLDEEQEN